MTTICTHCNGTGHTPYLAFNIVTRTFVPVTEITWLMLPDTEEKAEIKRQNFCRVEIDECRFCYGTGEIDNTLEEKWDAAEHRWEERRDRG